MLLNERVDTLATISIVADLDRLLMVAYMNACTLSGVIAMDIEDFGITWCSTLGKLLADHAHQCYRLIWKVP